MCFHCFSLCLHCLSVPNTVTVLNSGHNDGGNNGGGSAARQPPPNAGQESPFGKAPAHWSDATADIR